MYFILNCKFYECVLSLSCTNDYNRTHVTTKIQFKKLGSLGTVSPCTVRNNIQYATVQGLGIP